MHKYLLKEFKEYAPTRNGYGKALEKMAVKDKSIVAIDADLAGSTRSIWLKKTAPERFFYAGIAEQNAVGLAVGLALEEKTAFVSSFAMFITARAFEIIRQSICYNNVPVKVIGSHAGIMTGRDGPTAHATEDIAIMRCLPNMNIIVPADSVEAQKATEFIAKEKKPFYLRTNRDDTPVIFREEYEFEFGKGMELIKGEDATIIATGSMVSIAVQAAKQLEKEGIKTRVINMHSIKPLDEKIILKAANETNAILTAEDHQITGGLGTAVAETLAENKIAIPFKKIGLNGFAESGSPQELYNKYGLTKENLAEETKKLLKK